MKFTWIRATTSQVVSPNPAKVGSIIVTPDSDSSKADVTFYDGESTADPQILQLRGGGGITQTINFQPYLESKRGLYMEEGSNVAEVLIQLMWEPE